ncbi:HDL496Wp [Eremothecium sinecaudum]|uniref:Succinate dehydrogenase [ubiquinone] cytochrome b small subunit n=1 Tax=Eremothecium sinecaudum TaxID=45286 RepID=A0A109UYM3_9SACH|nr:HDL496Wp [Eremothecium sinecaudum]AMD20248.1 HDL496Wp [Eremothecium sinecaudum]
MFRTGLGGPGVLSSYSRNLCLRRSISLKPNFSRFKLIPPPAGGVQGDVNEAFKPPAANYLEGSYHWYYERITSVALIPMFAIVPFYGALTGTLVGFPILDAVLCSTILIHGHLGLTSCIIDYIPKRKFGIWHNIARAMLLAGSVVGLCGIYELETNDNGLTDLVLKLWNGKNSEDANYRY